MSGADCACARIVVRMSSVVSKWVVLESHAVAPDDLDAEGVLRDDAVARWIDDARRAYLDCCAVLRAAGERAGLAINCEMAELPTGAQFGAPETVNVSAGATEVWPDSFRIAFRIRSFGSMGDMAFNTSCTVSLEDPATGERAEIGDDVRDELIALAHNARHFN
jgi:acyl-CoA thioesterase FadM